MSIIHELERMALGGWSVEILPANDGVYLVRIKIDDKEFLGSSGFSLMQAIENAEAKVRASDLPGS